MNTFLWLYKLQILRYNPNFQKCIHDSFLILGSTGRQQADVQNVYNVTVPPRDS